MTTMDPGTRREEEELGRLLALLDHEPPGIDLAALDRHRLEEAARRRRGWRGEIAASVAFLVAVGALAYAVPGSPVRGWIRAAVGIREPGPETAGEGELSGVAVVPSGPLEVVFSGSAGGPIDVRLVDTDMLELRVQGQPAEVASEEGRLVVSGGGPDSRYEILVPRTARGVRIVVAGRIAWEKSGAGIVTDAPAGASGGYRLAPR